MDVIVGTAGHIDHGKTALVRALTGVDTDRLPEEKRRGITIDLGFAHAQFGDANVAFVDVPGHERFVKNMLAGASGIDLVMLVVAADEGVMPQTREHFDICRLLSIAGGVIAITKADLVDAETLQLARLDVSELVQNSFLEDAKVFDVSSVTGAGIAELKEGLVRAASSLRRGNDIRTARLPVDRSFSVKGFGSVVTGTLASAHLAEGEDVELLPEGKKLRVRGIQTHGQTISTATAGQRTAVNLAGVDHYEITRGMVLTSPGGLGVTQAFDAEVEVLPDASRALRSRHRVRLHIDTAEILARLSVLNAKQEIEPGGKGFVQFRLESSVVAAHGDRFIIRSYSPQRTIGGGRVLDPAASRHRRSEYEKLSHTLSALANAADGEGSAVEIFVRMSGERGLRLSEIRRRTGLNSSTVDSLITAAKLKGSIVEAGDVFVDTGAFKLLASKALALIETHHRSNKLSRGIPRETLREQVFGKVDADVYRAVTDALERDGKIVSDKDVFKLASHETQLSAKEALVLDRLRKLYSDAGLEVPKLDDALLQASEGTGLDQKSARQVFQMLVSGGELVAITSDFYFSTDAMRRLTDKLRGQSDTLIDVSVFKELAGVSRKYAIPLLEYFDRTRVTQRVGDKRRIL